MTTKPKVLIHVPIEDDLTAQIRAVADVEELNILSPREALLEAVKDIDGILLTPRVRADAEFFEAAANLKVLSTTSVSGLNSCMPALLNVALPPGCLLNALGNPRALRLGRSKHDV